MCRVVVLSMAFPYSSMHLCTRAQPTKACPRLALPYSSMPTLGFALFKHALMHTPTLGFALFKHALMHTPTLGFALFKHALLHTPTLGFALFKHAHAWLCPIKHALMHTPTLGFALFKHAHTFGFALFKHALMHTPQRRARTHLEGGCMAFFTARQKWTLILTVRKVWVHPLHPTQCLNHVSVSSLASCNTSTGTQGRVGIVVSSFTSCNTSTGDTGAGQYLCVQLYKLQHKHRGHRSGSVSLCPALQAATQAITTQGRVSIFEPSLASCNTSTGDTGAGQYRCVQPYKLQHKHRGHRGGSVSLCLALQAAAQAPKTQGSACYVYHRYPHHIYIIYT